MKVIYCRNNHPFSFLIRALTWSRWSHCGVIVGNDVVHATASEGVVREPLAKVKREYPSHEIRTMPGDAEKALEFLGKGYDWGGVFGVRWGAWDSPKRWFCSELVAHCSGLRVCTEDGTPLFNCVVTKQGTNAFVSLGMGKMTPEIKTMVLQYAASFGCTHIEWERLRGKRFITRVAGKK